jgi:hypothetical protein
LTKSTFSAQKKAGLNPSLIYTICLNPRRTSLPGKYAINAICFASHHGAVMDEDSLHQAFYPAYTLYIVVLAKNLSLF